MYVCNIYLISSSSFLEVIEILGEWDKTRLAWKDALGEAAELRVSKDAAEQQLVASRFVVGCVTSAHIICADVTTKKAAAMYINICM